MEKTSIDKWLKNYGDMLYRYAYVRVDSEQTAEDLVQDAFLAAWNSREGFRNDASEKNWLFRILKNKIIDYYRTTAKKMRNEMTRIENDSESYFNEEEMWRKSEAPSIWPSETFEQVETAEFYEVLDRCRKDLNQMQNAAFSMRYLEGQESSEICKELEISSSNYWVIIHRAKLKLRKCIELLWINQ